MRRRGFTLVELLVVLAIFLLVTVIALPAVYSSLSGRQVTDGARILTGALVGMHDSAIKYNSPRGLRLLPDPVLTLPAPGLANAGTTQLVYNRMIPIEPAGDYSAGKISIGPQLPVDGAQTGFPPRMPRGDGSATNVYPFVVSPGTSDVLMVEESPYSGGFILSTAAAMPNEGTNWYWNVRVGDKIKIGKSGRAYTIVGPCLTNPWNDIGGGIGNPELFVNVGDPGTPSPLLRTYYKMDLSAAATTYRPEFLFLVNSEDDNLDGYVDSGWDGFDNNNNGQTDELLEWETEVWPNSVATGGLKDAGDGTASPSADLVLTVDFKSGTYDQPYIITRRPLPSPGAREIMLPAGIVIDATTGIAVTGTTPTKERSRLPITPGSLFVDIMVDPSGSVIPTTEYSAPTSAQAVPFMHFWLTERDDVHPVGTIPASAGVSFLLPMTSTALSTAGAAPTSDGQFYPGTTGLPVLKGERRLVTLFTQTGLVTTNTIESIAPINNYQPGEGFKIDDVNYPFLKAQQGSREAR